MNYEKLFSKLEGLTIESSKFYWLRMQAYKHDIISQMKYSTTIEAACNEAFLQALLNCYFDVLLNPTERITCSCLNKLISFRDFIKDTYANAHDILEKWEHIDDNLLARYNITMYMQQYVDAYLAVINKSNYNVFEHLLCDVLNKLLAFLPYFNINFPNHQFSENEITYLTENFKQLALLHIKSNVKCEFYQPWTSAIYVKHT